MQINIKPQNGDDAPWQRSGRESARARTSELAREREREKYVQVKCTINE